MSAFLRSAAARFRRPGLWAACAALLSVCALLPVLLAGGQATARGSTAAPARSTAVSATTGGGVSERTRWEYATVPLPQEATKQALDVWGADGWELVTVVLDPRTQGFVAFLKRVQLA